MCYDVVARGSTLSPCSLHTLAMLPPHPHYDPSSLAMSDFYVSAQSMSMASHLGGGPGHGMASGQGLGFSSILGAIPQPFGASLATVSIPFCNRVATTLYPSRLLAAYQ